MAAIVDRSVSLNGVEVTLSAAADRWPTYTTHLLVPDQDGAPVRLALGFTRCGEDEARTSFRGACAAVHTLLRAGFAMSRPELLAEVHAEIGE